MTTKEDGTFLKQESSGANEFSTPKNNRKFSTFNLNQSQKYSDFVYSSSGHTLSKSSNIENKATLLSAGYTVTDRFQENEKSWNKSTIKCLKTSKNPLLNEKDAKVERHWINEKKDSSNPIRSSSSTLSLHIAAYENSIEAASDEYESDSLKSSKTFEPALSIFQANHDCLEFPRQQEGGKSNKSEVQQFTASQKLFAPNQDSNGTAAAATPSSSSTSAGSTGTGITQISSNTSIETAKLPSPIAKAKAAAAAAADGERKHYKKDPSQRIFVGRSLRLEKIKFYGFDMDYTLANYKSPQYEALLFDRTIERLIQIGYPEDLKQFVYDPNFPVRGLWFDSHFGNLLKVDGFGNILIGVHGTKSMKAHEIEEFYPNKFLKLVENRVHVLNTLFNLPDMYLLAKLVDYYDNLPGYKKSSDKTGVRSGETVMSYKSITQDVVGAVNWVHISGGMKDYILQNMDKYIHKADELRNMMLQLRSAGAKTFLLTNSEYKYTNGVMTYLAGPDWPQLFDIAIVDAKKPAWFSESSVFRQVDTSTGTLKVGMHAGQLKRGNVYAGGSCDGLKRLMKFRGKDVLYVGDHIFGDVLRSKKSRGWRTFLVVPELTHELTVWTDRHQLFEQLETFDATLGRIYKNLDFRSTNNDQQRNSIDDAVKAIRKVTHEMDQAYGLLGSLFRSGTRTTFFATQVERYADLYSSSTYNLIHYPKFYFFRAPMMLLPHESTVDHLAKITDKRKKPGQSVVGSRQPSLCHEDSEDDLNLEEKNPPSEKVDSEIYENSSKDYVKKGDSKN